MMYIYRFRTDDRSSIISLGFSGWLMHVPQAEHHTIISSVYECLTNTHDAGRLEERLGEMHSLAHQTQLLALLRTVASGAHSISVLGRLASYCPGSQLLNWGLL